MLGSLLPKVAASNLWRPGEAGLGEGRHEQGASISGERENRRGERWPDPPRWNLGDNLRNLDGPAASFP